KTPQAFIHQGAVFFICDYHPGAQTLSQCFLEKPGGLLSEVLLWSIVCQLLGALRAAHAAGGALQNVHPNRVIITLGNRVRLNWVGCLDVLEFETRKQVSELQQQDMRDLGLLMLSLACRARVTAAATAESAAFLSQHYSPEYHNLAVSLVAKAPNVFEVRPIQSRRASKKL
ncbi:unnamed protein product, partial [Discosporangium mesarthrocarpum]